MVEPTHRFIETNGIRLHVAERGSGPLVVLCHGFPELWYSWRHQISALAAAGFHAVAPDMRGYGQSDCPADIDSYTSFHIIGDMVGMLDALRAETAVIVGHDWGAPIAWRAAVIVRIVFAPSSGSVHHTRHARFNGRRQQCQMTRPLSSTSSIFKSRAWPRQSLSATYAARCAACFP